MIKNLRRHYIHSQVQLAEKAFKILFTDSEIVRVKKNACILADCVTDYKPVSTPSSAPSRKTIYFTMFDYWCSNGSDYKKYYLMRCDAM
jgi:hypothetical protein